MTKYFIGGRQSGKTMTLLRSMAEDPSIIMVCASREMAQAAHRTSESLGLLIDRARFMTPTEVREYRPSHRGPRAEPRFVVDNVNLVLERLLGGVIEAITGTGYPSTPPLSQQDAEDAVRAQQA